MERVQACLPYELKEGALVNKEADPEPSLVGSIGGMAMRLRSRRKSHVQNSPGNLGRWMHPQEASATVLGRDAKNLGGNKSFCVWVDHLFKGVAVDEHHKSLSHVAVQTHHFQNLYIMAWRDSKHTLAAPISPTLSRPSMPGESLSTCTQAY